MSESRPAVYPLTGEAAEPEDGGVLVVVPAAGRVRMKDVQGMPGTAGGLALRVCQLVFAIVAVTVMAATSDFSSASAFRYLVAAASLQSLWSFALASVDIYCLAVKRCLRNTRVLCLFAIGDGMAWSIVVLQRWLLNGWIIFDIITSTLTFAAACASAGITVLLGNDLNSCGVNHCTSFETATAMAFISWFAGSPSFLLNFWSLGSK